MSSANPFADEPLPEHAVRLQSAADPLDPYAAPSGMAEYKTDLDPGVGMWRDGKWLVVHREATFPPRCILSNLEAETFNKQTITWAHLNDWRGQTVKLNYGMTFASRSRLRWRLGIAIAVDVVALTIALGIVGLVLDGPPEFSAPFVGFGGLVLAAVMGATLKVAWNAVNTLSYVSSNKAYVWLSGAGTPFLNSLPPWPGFRS